MPENPELPGDQGTESRSQAASRSALQLDLRADSADAQTQGVMLSELLGFSRWLLVIPFVLVVLFFAGKIALLRQPVVAAADTRSMLSADYSPWEFASFAPVDIDIISHIQGEGGGSVARLVIPGNYWPGPAQASPEPTLPSPRATPVAAVLTEIPPTEAKNKPNTPTATATRTAASPVSTTVSPQPTLVYTRTPTPTVTPIFTLFPTSTATPTRRPPELPTATITSTSPPSPTASRTPTAVPSATQPPPTATATTAPSATATTAPSHTPTNTPVPPTPTETTPPPPPPPPTPSDTPVPPDTPTPTPITPVPFETPTPLPPPPNNPSESGSYSTGPSGSESRDYCWYMNQNYLPREIILPACQHLPAQTQP